MNTNLTPLSTVHLVDDDDSFRTALSRLLKAAGYEVQTYKSAVNFLLERTSEMQGCLLLDIRMPGASGLELQEALHRQNTRLPVIFLTAHGDIPMSVRAMKSGAVDFLTKPVKREDLLIAVKSALRKETASRISEANLQTCQLRFNTLTVREREVFFLAVAGKMNKEIAAQLGTAERTVKSHRAQVMTKMQAGSFADLVRMADHLQVNETSSLQN